ncbi:hypothetical protein [Rossellomorea sp. LjRoot5]|uniref:hypothetical protein n=1 Tax=Rossellomorea sp. LjRoot5 TaxID=3342331 RepID=UPI003ED0AEFF
MYILNFICWDTGELLEDEPRKFSREEGQMFLDNVIGQSVAQFDREVECFINYYHYKTVLVSPKSNKVTKRYNLLFKKVPLH